ncbi:hypothetical protein D3C74_336600 [compost metagenome]
MKRFMLVTLCTDLTSLKIDVPEAFSLGTLIHIVFEALVISSNHTSSRIVSKNA